MVEGVGLGGQVVHGRGRGRYCLVVMLMGGCLVFTVCGICVIAKTFFCNMNIGTKSWQRNLSGTLLSTNFQDSRGQTIDCLCLFVYFCGYFWVELVFAFEVAF